MAAKHFHIINRFKQFVRDIDKETIRSPRFYFNLAGWLITFFFLFISIETDTNWKTVWFIFNFYFLITLNKCILEKIRPPVELILISLLTFYSIEYTYLNHKLNLLSIQGLNPILDFFTAIIILHLGLLFVINSPANRINILKTNLIQQKYNQFGLIFYVLLWFIAHRIGFWQEDYLLIILQIVLFFILLGRTAWLERLTRYELIVYFFISVIIFASLSDPEGFDTSKEMLVSANQITTWYSIPYFIHFLVKIYFLVLAVKIPIVLIYNHAGLARKLKIASLFQSTFPQLIQFIFLIIIFFYFISGWQALNLRGSIYEHLQDITRSDYNQNKYVHKVSLIGESNIIFLPGYEPRQIVFELPEHGVISLIKINLPGTSGFSNRDYFLFRKVENNLYLSKMDENFIQQITADLPLISGSGILMYPFAPLEWQKLLYDDYMQDDPSLRIYPFAFFSRNDNWTISATFAESSPDSNDNKIIKISTLFSDKKFVVGRVFFPVAGEENGENPYLAMDIYQKSNIFSVNQTILNILLVLAGFFFLVEIFVINRLNKFGTEINNIIVQKFDILKNGIRQISSGNLDYKLIMGGEDEFVELAGRFNEMGDKLKSTIDEVREKDRLDHELKIARQVQMSLLPAQLPKISGYRIAASINTANEIGGDFYDILPLDEHTYLFSIGDVSGKGSSAAFYMAQFISLLRFSPQFTNKPSEIAQRLNSYFSTEVKDRQIFVTSVIGILDTSKNTVKFVRTGHTPPILIPANHEKEIQEISSDGLGIGLTKTGETFKSALKEKTVKLGQGDIILLYTDGVVEAATGAEGEAATVFGEERLMKILSQFRGGSARDIVHKVTEEINIFYQEQMPVDDYTLFIIQRKKGE